MIRRLSRGNIVACVGGACILAALFAHGLGPASVGYAAPQTTFSIESGEGFSRIATRLEGEGMLRSRIAFELFAFLRGRAQALQPGVYPIRASMSAPMVLASLAREHDRVVTVIIPEGSSLYKIRETLRLHGVLGGALLPSRAEDGGLLEGRMFPDTYRLFANATPEEIMRVFLSNFETQTAPYVGRDAEQLARYLVLASFVEREVPDLGDRKIVAGILEKRLQAGMPLQVDATICYIKEMEADRPVPCYPLTPLDFKRDSPYNTYLHTGLPPGPIGNPSISALRAVLEPTPSPYWFYLSDPETKKTIFSATFEEHVRMKARYLGRARE